MWWSGCAAGSEPEEEMIVEKDDKNQKIKKKLGRGSGLRLVGEGNG